MFNKLDFFRNTHILSFELYLNIPEFFGIEKHA